MPLFSAQIEVMTNLKRLKRQRNRSKPMGFLISWLALFVPLIISSLAAHAGTNYRWKSDTFPPGEALQNRITPPKGFTRKKAEAHSFGYWLRRLPLKPLGSPVMLYNGRLKSSQNIHVAVVDIDVGKRDLQQCADAVMRLRAEYLYAQNRLHDIRFNFTGGTPVSFSRWSRGERPHVSGRRTSWRSGARKGRDRKNFMRYMTMIFSYAGTYSLSRELKSIKPGALRVGDVFIKGGFPGHAVIVADMASNPNGSEKRFLLIQSYMPAQDMHVLKNPLSQDGSPWFELPKGGQLITPEWTFEVSQLKRFPD